MTFPARFGLVPISAKQCSSASPTTAALTGRDAGTNRTDRIVRMLGPAGCPRTT